jgi:hypothetical protein
MGRPKCCKSVKLPNKEEQSSKFSILSDSASGTREDTENSYEQLRAANVRRNLSIMAELGIDKVVGSIESAARTNIITKAEELSNEGGGFSSFRGKKRVDRTKEVPSGSKRLELLKSNLRSNAVLHHTMLCGDHQAEGIGGCDEH